MKSLLYGIITLISFESYAIFNGHIEHSTCEVYLEKRHQNAEIIEVLKNKGFLVKTIYEQNKIEPFRIMVEKLVRSDRTSEIKLTDAPMHYHASQSCEYSGDRGSHPFGALRYGFPSEKCKAQVRLGAYVYTPPKERTYGSPQLEYVQLDKEEEGLTDKTDFDTEREYYEHAKEEIVNETEDLPICTII